MFFTSFDDPGMIGDFFSDCIFKLFIFCYGRDFEIVGEDGKDEVSCETLG